MTQALALLVQRDHLQLVNEFLELFNSVPNERERVMLTPKYDVASQIILISQGIPSEHRHWPWEATHNGAQLADICGPSPHSWYLQCHRHLN